MCVGKSTFKTSKLLPCDPTLQHRGKENVEFIRNKTKTKKQKVWKTANLKTFATLETRKQEKKEKKDLSWATFISPPPRRTFQERHMWIPLGASRQQVPLHYVQYIPPLLPLASPLYTFLCPWRPAQKQLCDSVCSMIQYGWVYSTVDRCDIRR